MHSEQASGERQRGVLEIEVECYAGYRGEETPRRFSLNESVTEVTDVLDAWLAPDHRYFKVLGRDGGCYILRHDIASDRWELTMYDRTRAIGGLPLAPRDGLQDDK